MTRQDRISIAWQGTKDLMFAMFVNKVDDGAMISKLYLPNKSTNIFIIEIYIPR